MKVDTIKTHKITTEDRSLLAILDAYVSSFEERMVLAITSKIVAICQGRVVKIGAVDKRALIAQEADYYLPPATSKYHVTLTIKDGLLMPTAGIDESNGNGYYVLWPREAQQTANEVRAYLRRRFTCEHVGVIITDSKTTPLRLGVTGVALAYSGFRPLNDYVGSADLFGRPLRVTKVNVVDALATTTVMVMGEGHEQTPLAVMSDLPFVAFQDRDPTAEEVRQLQIALEDDLYGPLLTSVRWHKGQQQPPAS
jgi:putative folate metabolism gamma-glutamate ligase